MDFAVHELYALIDALKNTGNSSLKIETSCSVRYEVNLTKRPQRLKLQQLTIETNITSQTLDALLDHLDVEVVLVKNCNVMNGEVHKVVEDKKVQQNNTEQFFHIQLIIKLVKI